MQKQTLAIIGTGNVGATLGKRWAEQGHTVRFATRDPQADKVQALLADIEGESSAHPIAEAVQGAEIVLLAVPWDGVAAALAEAGDLSGKILVDATNPLLPGYAGLAVGFETSAAEEVARLAPGARLVKAFNTTGTSNMADVDFPDGPPTMFVCGDDAEAKAPILALAEALGFEAVDVGGLKIARYLEPLAMLWIDLAYHQGWGPDFAFRLIRR